MKYLLKTEKIEIKLTNKIHLSYLPSEWIFSDDQTRMILRGDNGSGKTTFFNILCGLIKPKSGEANLNMNVISGKGPAHSAKSGIIRGFQSPLLCNELKVWENISLPYLNSLWLNPNKHKEVIREELEGTGIEDLYNLSPSELSFGQRRLVELLRIKMQIKKSVKKLILLDEPLAGLDSARTELALKLIHSITKIGIPMILINHNHRNHRYEKHVPVIELVKNEMNICQFKAVKDIQEA